MKALTVRQPWAGLIVGSYKKTLGLHRRAEVRSWATSYRGPLIIHAGQRVDEDACAHFGVDPKRVERGALIGGVNVAGIVRVRSETSWCELRPLHLEPTGRPYSDDTFVWIFSDSFAAVDIVKARGKLGLWTPAQELFQEPSSS